MQLCTAVDFAVLIRRGSFHGGFTEFKDGLAGVYGSEYAPTDGVGFIFEVFSVSREAWHWEAHHAHFGCSPPEHTWQICSECNSNVLKHPKRAF